MRRMMLGEISDELKRKTSIATRLATRIGAATGATANLSLVRKVTKAWMPLGQRIVIIGGELVGIELAEFLAERGRKVSVLEEAPRLGKGLTLVRRMRILAELAEHGVGLHGGVSEIAIDATDVSFVDAAGKARRLAAARAFAFLWVAAGDSAGAWWAAINSTRVAHQICLHRLFVDLVLACHWLGARALDRGHFWRQRHDGCFQCGFSHSESFQKAVC